jgi:type II secretory pathway component GspD/PulD (secretin)
MASRIDAGPVSSVARQLRGADGVQPRSMKRPWTYRWAALALALCVAAGCDRQRPDPHSARRVAGSRTLSSFDPPAPGEKSVPAGMLKFEQAELARVLRVYAEISGRSVILGANVPEVKVTFSNQTSMGAVEVLQALDTVLAAQGIAMVFLGTQYVKVVPAKEACSEPGPVVELRPDQLPESSSFLIYIVKVRKVTPSYALQALQPFAKLPNSLVAIRSEATSQPPSKPGPLKLPVLFGSKEDGILILRDYSANVRRMLQVLEKLEQP